MEFVKGSEWRIWDLHLHTASSYDYEYKAEDCDKILAQKLQENSVAAVAITDHFVIDKDRICRLRELAPDIVFFPGVELRTDKGDTNIHVILIFSDKLDLCELVEDFNVFKREAQNKDDEERIYWDYNSQILPFAKRHDALISIHAGRKSNGVDKKISNSLPHDQAVKTEYATTISIFEMGQTRDMDEYNKRVFPTIGIKPMVICSDNHDARKYNLINKLWIKADVTFNGLKQILYEPEERVKISQTPPDYKAEYYVIDKVEFYDEDFQDTPIEFNENLTCIIGGKSTGKSILLHNLANSIDPSQVQEKEDKSSSCTRNIEKVSVIWKDGKRDETRKIVYIPQTYLNRLSDAKESTTEIDRIIEEIVWLNSDAKAAHTFMIKSIKEYKIALNTSILGLIANRKELDTIRNDKQEIGSRENIETQIEKLTSQKDILSTDLNISKGELDLYDKTIADLATLDEQILSLQNDLTIVKGIESVVEKIALNFFFSDHTQELMTCATDNAITAANEVWIKSKKTIIDSISKELAEKENKRENLFKIRDGLKNKVQENKFITELSNNIHEESEKLKNLTALEKREALLIEKENAYISDICKSIEKYKSFHNQYAQSVNEKPEFKSNDLEFSVGVPFKKEAYIDKVLRLFDNRSTVLKETISIDDFTEDRYTEQLLRDFINKILDEKLQPKKGNNKESAIRDLCEDWFEIKYNVKMDNDTIDVMSPGKKALVLLKLLIDLADSKCPILIDQPEDDLDNRSVFNDLIPFIKRKKKDRQIIIVTHNANVVLGSDAEEVIVANQKGSNVPNKQFRFEYRSGAIENNMPLYNDNGDVEPGILNSQGIQQHICDILEGGEQAFELRKNKYHI